jgi:flagellar biogenesis protein FliO
VQRAARTAPPADEPKLFPASTERHRPLAQASHQPTREPLALSKGSGNPSSRVPGALRSVLSLFAALGAVIGLLLATMWGLRRVLPKDTSALPGDVFQVLGRKPLLGRQQAQVVRFGNKLVLLSVSPLGAESLAEITDPAEVERLTGLCRQPSAGPATTVFRQVMDQLAREPTTPGFVGSGQASNLELAMRGLGRGKPREPHDA